LDFSRNLPKIASVLVVLAAYTTKLVNVLLLYHFSITLYGAAVRRLIGLHGETCHVLLRDHFSNTRFVALLFVASAACMAKRIKYFAWPFHTKNAMRWNHNGPSLFFFSWC
jgi:hypothetical protein